MVHMRAVYNTNFNLVQISLVGHGRGSSLHAQLETRASEAMTTS